MDILPSANGAYNTYAYDAEGRLCASKAGSIVTQYIYDAGGHRVAKGSIHLVHDAQRNVDVLSCDVSANAFSETNAYVIGASGAQMTEVANSAWQHTNVGGSLGLLATYDLQGLHYQLSDWMGNRRIQTDPNGAIEETCSNQPFGDNQLCYIASAAPVTADDATEHHFTGMERDTESGLDNFEARYYASSMGRFMSPDPSGLAYADPANPQSLNLYAYALNNPLKFIDPSGLFCEYPADDYTPQNGHLEDTDYHSNQGDCESSGGMWHPDGSLKVYGDFADAVYSLRGYFTEQILSKQTTECQALASFVSTVQEIGDKDPMPAIIALTNKPGGAVEKGGDKILGVTTNRDGQHGFNAIGGQSGFQQQYQNDQPDFPAIGWNGDQSHHFAAFFQTGANSPHLRNSAASVWERIQAPKSPNQGDVRLGDEAAKLGAAWKANPGDVGAQIRSQVCQ